MFARLDVAVNQSLRVRPASPSATSLATFKIKSAGQPALALQSRVKHFALQERHGDERCAVCGFAEAPVMGTMLSCSMAAARGPSRSEPLAVQLVGRERAASSS